MNKKDFYKNFYSDIKLSDDEKNFILNDLHKQLSNNKYQNRFFKTPQFKAVISLALSVCIITSAITYNQSSHKHDILINNKPSDTSCEQTTAVSVYDDNMTSTPPAVDSKDNTASAETKEFINTTIAADESRITITNNDFIGSDDNNPAVTTAHDNNINDTTMITDKNPDVTNNITEIVTTNYETLNTIITNEESDETFIVTTLSDGNNDKTEQTSVVTTQTQSTTRPQPVTTTAAATNEIDMTQGNGTLTEATTTTTTEETTVFIYSEPSVTYETSPPPDTLTNPE